MAVRPVLINQCRISMNSSQLWTASTCGVVKSDFHHSVAIPGVVSQLNVDGKCTLTLESKTLFMEARHVFRMPDWISGDRPSHGLDFNAHETALTAGWAGSRLSSATTAVV
ncbi:hypothetical protein Ae201684P_000150 [Aphanomyces euteiches]|uniref:Uncharacterized protein n=1 Tax=Aphanomyces euteiches TaxID=100861 RepID=A0A6G0XA50_9STRA|nr:hypothetical protein Ae201684_006806 [Aphanomyces euteiches]KAH9086728.1 hypothetical protein Ae201684P_000150 [Aphanomyces euteiches]